MAAIVTVLMKCTAIQTDRMGQTITFRNVFGGATDATANTGQANPTGGGRSGVPQPPTTMQIRNTAAAARGQFAKGTNYSVAISAA